MFVYLGGIPGVGKTTVVSGTLDIARAAGFSLVGMEEKKVLCELAGVGSPEEYRVLPVAVRTRARREMVACFYAVDCNDPQVVRMRDDHFVYPQEDGSYLARPYELGDKNQMLAIVVLWAEPKAILGRRLRKYAERPDRPLSDVPRVIEHQALEIATAIRQANFLDIPVRILHNQEGMSEKTSQLVVSFVREAVALRGG